MEIVHYIFTCALGLYAFFFMRLLKEHDSTRKLADRLANDLSSAKSEIKMLEKTFELKHDVLGKQMDKLCLTIERLAEKVDKLNESIHELRNSQ